MKGHVDGGLRAVADFTGGCVLVTVEIAAPLERVFRALASREIVDWWVRPGVFDTREWTGEVRVGGRWQATGVARGQPYTLEGEFLEVDPPRKLVHTWHLVGAPGKPTTVTFLLEESTAGTRVTLRHSGFPRDESGANVSAGWESSFQHLAKMFNGRQELAQR